MDWWEDIVDEGLMKVGVGLHVRSENLRVTTEIHEESVTHPSTFHFDNIEGDIVQKVLKG